MEVISSEQKHKKKNSQGKLEYYIIGGALPEERKSQVGLGSVRKGASSSIYKFGSIFYKLCLKHLVTTGTSKSEAVFRLLK